MSNKPTAHNDASGLNLGDENGDDDVLPFKYSITAYGADYPVDGLVKRLRTGDVFVPPFQRSYIWKLKQASRFIESLLLGLPVPGIFLSKDAGTGKLLVIDGQQRLRSLQYFYEGVFGTTRREFSLLGVVPSFEGLTYATLEPEDRRQLDDSIIHATIVQQDKPTEDQSSIYFIFERLNTGGVPLQPQQIRASIYFGAFQSLLEHLNANEDWRKIYGSPNKSLRDQELILRFFAFYFASDKYERPMKEFLNSYMGSNRNLQKQDTATLTNAFTGTIQVVAECLGKEVFRPQRALNAAVFDAVMVGLARRVSSGPIKGCSGLLKAYQELLADEQFVAATERATATEESIRSRLSLATRAFVKLR